MEYINLAWAYRDVIFDLLLALHGVALVIVNITKTPADNAVLGKAYKSLEVIAGLIGRRAKS